MPQSCPSASLPGMSVVVTAYNHARFLATALDSVLDQGISGLDIVVVDDGSRDDTLAIARSYERRGVRVVAKPNGGPSSAINAGIAAARGEAIAFLSADDALLPDSIAMRQEALALTGADIVSASPVWIDDEGRELTAGEYPHVFDAPAGLSPLEIFERLYLHGNFICAPAVAIRRSCLDSVGAFDGALWQLQDYDYWLRGAAKGFRFQFLQQPLVRYRTHADNLSTANPERLAYESGVVLMRAAGLLDIADLRELLFGRGLRDVDCGLDVSALAQLLACRHWRYDLRTVAGWEFGRLLQHDAAAAALARGLSFGIVAG